MGDEAGKEDRAHDEEAREGLGFLARGCDGRDVAVELRRGEAREDAEEVAEAHGREPRRPVGQGREGDSFCDLEGDLEGDLRAREGDGRIERQVAVPAEDVPALQVRGHRRHRRQAEVQDRREDEAELGGEVVVVQTAEQRPGEDAHNDGLRGPHGDVRRLLGDLEDLPPQAQPDVPTERTNEGTTGRQSTTTWSTGGKKF
mmetsp:Transcript_18014/g.58255  ORF Transcript_18014/g.58255 Transcript_18014/m.58255 type:complete len:201 (+) Transcript_18014:3520-4122(+)